MPGYNGTGPAREGRMSGRGRGYCIVPVEEINLSAPRGGDRRPAVAGCKQAGPGGKGHCGGRNRGIGRMGAAGR